MFAAKVVASLTEDGAAALQTEQRFNTLAKTAGTTGAALLSSLKSASGGEISDLNLQLEASKAEFLGVAKSAQDFSTLMAIARNNAQSMGLTTQEAFDKLVDGLDKGSARALKQVGLNINLKDAEAAYASSIGVTVGQLTEEGKKQALVQAAMQQGEQQIQATGGAAANAAQSYQQFDAAVDNAKTKVGELLALDFKGPVSGIAEVANAAAQATESYNKWATANSGLASAIGSWLNPIQAYNDWVFRLGKSGLEWIGVLHATEPAVGAVGAAVQNTNAATQTAAQLTATVTAAELGYASSLEMTGVQSRAAAAAAQQKANADQVASVDAQTHALAQQQLAEQAQNAARALLAAGPAGASTAAMLAGSSQQVDILTAAYYRLAAAQQAAAQAAMDAKIKATIAQHVAAGSTGRGGSSDAAEMADANQRVALAAETARKQQAIALASKDQKVALLRDEYNEAVRLHGAESATAIDAQTKLMEAQQSGANKRASAAGAAATKLENIESKTSDKIESIVESTQKKITAITEREAAKQAAALQKLNENIATSAADRRASSEADDLDLVGVKDSKEAARLNDRERAEASAREREKQAAAEARATAEAGDAELAQKQYDIKEKQIDAQQQLDEKYYSRQRELSGDPANEAALKKQYDEATRANEEAAQARIDIAKQEADQKKSEVQAEKDAVIAAANDQANQVVSAAERSAQGVKKATQSARDKGVADLKAIGDAVTAIPAQKTITITVNQAGKVDVGSAGGGSSGNKAAGGGSFMTKGPTNLTVGDNPGGQELVTVTPLSGKGQSHASGNLVALAGGGAVLVDAGNGYTTPVAGTGGGTAGGGGAGKKAPAAIDPKKALDEMKNTVQLLTDMAKLKEEIAALAGVPAFDIPLVQALVDRAQQFTAYVAGHLVPITKAEGESLARYVTAATGAASVIKDLADLKKQIAELKNVPAFDQPTVLALIDRAQQFTAAMQQRLIPLTEFEATQMTRYRSAVGDTVSILKDVADLKKTMAEDSAPIISDQSVILLANQAAHVETLVNQRLVPATKEQADGLSQYAETVSASVNTLKDVLDLGKTLKENGEAAISDEVIIRLADQGVHIASLVNGRLIPVTKAQDDAMSAYASMVSASTSTLKSVLDLSGKLFADYTSPTDAQIGMLAADAKRVADGVMAAAANYSTDGLAAGKAYAEGVGATFSAFKDGLLFFDALKSDDFKLDTNALASFEQSTLTTLDVAKRLGAVAATIPAGDIAALQTTTQALTAQSEALIKLAAVPFGDLPGAAAGLAQQSAALLGGLGGGTTTIYNTFNLPSGSNQQTAQEVIRLLNQQMRALR